MYFGDRFLKWNRTLQMMLHAGKITLLKTNQEVLGMLFFALYRVPYMSVTSSWFPSLYRTAYQQSKELFGVIEREMCRNLYFWYIEEVYLYEMKWNIKVHVLQILLFPIKSQWCKIILNVMYSIRVFRVNYSSKWKKKYPRKANVSYMHW